LRAGDSIGTVQERRFVHKIMLPFDEPVTQSTLGTVKTFLGLSSARAYKRFYPAVAPR
jgi:vacuolar-type H+-ATPase catalytic subunit A/Vma1